MLAKFINMVMERGKKSAAEKIVYGAIDRIGEKKPARRAAKPLPCCSRRWTTSSPWSK